MRAEQLAGAKLDYLQQKFTHPDAHTRPTHTLTQVCVVAPTRGRHINYEKLVIDVAPAWMLLNHVAKVHFDSRSH